MSEDLILTTKLQVRRSEHYETYLFYCPGCKEIHPYCTKSDQYQWQFNGDIEKPTFTPSLLLRRKLSDYVGCGPRCHVVLTDGILNFCSDCEHELASKSVPMVEIPT